MTLLAMWLLYTVFGVTVFSLAFVWAVRARQFAGQDRARFLPLETPEPISAPTPNGPALRVLAVPLLLLALAAITLGGTAWYVLTR